MGFSSCSQGQYQQDYNLHAQQMFYPTYVLHLTLWPIKTASYLLKRFEYLSRGYKISSSPGICTRRSMKPLHPAGKLKDSRNAMDRYSNPLTLGHVLCNTVKIFSEVTTHKLSIRWPLPLEWEGTYFFRLFGCLVDFRSCFDLASALSCSWIQPLFECYFLGGITQNLNV